MYFALHLDMFICIFYRKFDLLLEAGVGLFTVLDR